MKISIYAPYAKERFETARQHSILHPERIVGNPEIEIAMRCYPAFRRFFRSARIST